MGLDPWVIQADPDDIERERRKAKELKRSTWWKNRIGNGKCHYCGERFPPHALTMDHLTPLVRGGKTSHSNCVPACRECNRNKENHPGVAWRVRTELSRNTPEVE